MVDKMKVTRKCEEVIILTSVDETFKIEKIDGR